MVTYRTRFAPSPTGLLHLGHAYSGLVGFRRAKERSGEFLLRIEDIDRHRCRPEFETAIFEDLAWLGLNWEQPVFRQSGRMDAYRAALRRLEEHGVLYPCRCTRADIRAALSAPQEGAPPVDPVYPGTCRTRTMDDIGPQDSIRLDLAGALDICGSIDWCETGAIYPGDHVLDSSFITTVGDIVLARRDIGTSYHLAVVVDDAEQGITEVVRGCDLWDATPVQRILQVLLELPAPTYFHHALIRDETGKRLAKRDDARAIRAYREAGLQPDDIRLMIGL